MQLAYRGIPYTVSLPAIEAIETQRQGIFLGNRFKIKLFQIDQRDLKTVQLTYRGAAYKSFVPKYPVEVQRLSENELNAARASLDSAYQG